jgi:hypothetical protein
MIKLPSLLTLACVFVAGSSGFTQQPGKPGHHLSMQVDIVSSGGSDKVEKKSGMNSGSPNPGHFIGGITTSSSSVSASSSHSSAPRYKVAVSNFGAAPEDAVIEWYVFAKSVSTSGPPAKAFVHGKGTEKLTVEGKKRAEIFFQPDPIVSTSTQAVSTRNQSLGGGTTGTLTATSKSTTGSKMTGWIVRLKVGNDLVAVKASSTAFEEMGKSGAEIK